ncbi:MFS transporter [Flavobacterium marginilacus]|uniref:MFS transporter n=1 Tax=Flavobacterium marginilacus TaxID=3003256 RepID=UPI00248EDCD2|nr:MFS transporter [Flavobacterium marginilacus]
MKDKFYPVFLSCTFLGALGEYMALTTLSWYLLETYSAVAIMGQVLSFRVFPRFFMGFIGGYWADIYDRKKMILLVYAGIMFMSLLQTILVTTISKPHWLLLAMTLFMRSIFDGAEPSIRNAILPDLVKKEAITKAVGLYATGLNLAAILAPILASFMMFKWDIKYVFWIDLCFQIPSFIVLFFVPKIKNIKSENQKTSIIKSYKEVIHFVYQSPILLNCVKTSILMMFLLFPFGAMLSIYVKEGLNLGVKEFGIISGIESGGAVLAGIFLSKIFGSSDKKIIRWHLLALLSGFILIAFYFKLPQLLFYFLIFLFGFLTQSFRSMSRIIFQKKAPDLIRGKLMSVIIADSGFVSLGLLLFTQLATKTDIFLTTLIMGILICSIMLVKILKSQKLATE